MERTGQRASDRVPNAEGVEGSGQPCDDKERLGEHQ